MERIRGTSEDTQYRQSAVRENLRKIFKMTTQRKHSPGQERSQVNKQVEGKDHQDKSAVKENPTIQEKSQPREQANRKCPRFEIPEGGGNPSFDTGQLCRGNRFSNQTQAPTMRKYIRRYVEHPDCRKS